MPPSTPLQDYLRKNGLAALETEFKINCKRHPDYPNLIQFKYDQIESPPYHPVVVHSRSCILDEANNWEYCAYPFNRFFNEGDQNAAAIDWSTAKVFDKVDGSIMILYFWDSKWHVASSGMPAASGEINGHGVTFRDHFWNTWNKLNYKMPQDVNLTYMFELCTMENRVVCFHKKPRIVFLGARDINTHQEFAPEAACNPEWELVESYPLTSIEEVLEAASRLDPAYKEGYVVCDGNFARQKKKSIQYTAVAHLRDRLQSTRKALLEVVRQNENTELLIYFPDLKQDLEVVRGQFNQLILDIEKVYEEIKHIPIQKDFALLATKTNFSSCLFQLRAKKTQSVRQFCNEMRLDGLAEWLGIK